MSENKERGIDSVVSFGGEHFVHWHTYNNIVKERDTWRDGFNKVEAERDSLRKEVERLRDLLSEMYSSCTAETCDDALAIKVKEALSGREGRG